MTTYPENATLNLARLTERTREARGWAERHPVMQIDAHGDCVATIIDAPPGTKLAANDDGVEPMLVDARLTAAMMQALMHQADAMIAADADITLTIKYRRRNYGWMAYDLKWHDGDATQIAEITALRGTPADHGLDAIAYDHVGKRMCPATPGGAYTDIGRWILDTTKQGARVDACATLRFRPGTGTITMTDTETGNTLEARPGDFAAAGAGR